MMPNEVIELLMLREANDILMARNQKLVEALGDMLTLEPTAEQRARATEVWQRERGVPT
jgi:hypothetical protein